MLVELLQLCYSLKKNNGPFYLVCIPDTLYAVYLPYKLVWIG